MFYTEATERRATDGGDDDTTGVPLLHLQLHSPPCPLNQPKALIAIVIAGIVHWRGKRNS